MNIPMKNMEKSNSEEKVIIVASLKKTFFFFFVIDMFISVSIETCKYIVHL